MTVRTWHQFAMWIILIFSMVHMYMAIREDMTHRQTTISSMVSGWRFYRDTPACGPVSTDLTGQRDEGPHGP